MKIPLDQSYLMVDPLFWNGTISVLEPGLPLLSGFRKFETQVENPCSGSQKKKKKKIDIQLSVVFATPLC